MQSISTHGVKVMYFVLICLCPCLLSVCEVVVVPYVDVVVVVTVVRVLLFVLHMYIVAALG